MLRVPGRPDDRDRAGSGRSEEHTSELQSLRHLVCRLLLEKKKINNRKNDKRIEKHAYITESHLRRIPLIKHSRRIMNNNDDVPQGDYDTDRHAHGDAEHRL